MAANIDERCWYREWIPRVGFGEWKLGVLLHWGVDFDEIDGGVGIYTVGVIEDLDDNRCRMVRADSISFADKRPTDDPA